MTYVIDIDNTICTTNGINYINSIPIQSRIDKINRLYTSGHIIVYYTGRGWDKLEMTKNQLKDWGCVYDSLILGKPTADFYIDDKNISIQEFFK